MAVRHDRNPSHECERVVKQRVVKRNSDAPFTGADGPLAYLITYATYGTWLHGDDRGSVDRQHNVPGPPFLSTNARRRRFERASLRQSPILLDVRARSIVHRTILEVANHRNWTVHAVNVRSNHVHVVISAPGPIEPVMSALKSWSTRRLVEACVIRRGTRVWVRHGSTRYLWNPGSLEAACRYVVDGQG